MGYWGWRPLLSTLVICVWVSGCSLSSATTLVVSPTSLPRITLTLRVREARAPTSTPIPPVTATPKPETPAPAQYYTVRPGDTLLGIAIDLGLTTHQLRAANPALDPLALQVGQQILLPQPGVVIAAAATLLPVQPDPPTCSEIITSRLLCIGQVRNSHDQPVTGVRLLLRLRGPDGKVLAETRTGIEQNRILPGDAAPYSVIFDAAEAGQVEAILLNAVPTGTQDMLKLEVVDEQVETNGSRYRVTAVLANNTGIAAGPPRVVLTVLDSEGRVAGYRVLTGPESLPPGARQTIRIDAVSQTGTDQLTHRLYIEARPS